MQLSTLIMLAVYLMGVQESPEMLAREVASIRSWNRELGPSADKDPKLKEVLAIYDRVAKLDERGLEEFYKAYTGRGTHENFLGYALNRYLFDIPPGVPRRVFAFVGSWSYPPGDGVVSYRESWPWEFLDDGSIYLIAKPATHRERQEYDVYEDYLDLKRRFKRRPRNSEKGLLWVS